VKKILKKITTCLVLLLTNLCFVVPSFSQENSIQEKGITSGLQTVVSKFLIDKDGQYLPEQLFKDTAEFFFKTEIDQIEASSFGTFWFKIKKDTSCKAKHLEIYCPNTEYIKAYTINKNKDTTTYPAKTYIEIQAFQFAKNYFNIQLSACSDQILIKIKVAKYSQLKINLNNENSHFKKERFLNSYIGFSLGILILLMLYHLVLYIKVKENLYLYYIVLVANSAVLITFGNIPLANYSIDRFTEIANDLFQISAISLCIAFLELKKRNIWAYKILLSFIPLIIFCRLFEILYPGLISKILIHAESIILYTTITTIALNSMFRNYKPDKLFIFPWIILLIGQIIFSLFSFHFFNITKNSHHAFEIGILLNAVFLALTFGNKLTMYKNEKKIAESNELKALSERDKVVNDQNKILETLITERNKEIINKISLLAKQKKEIQIQNEKIRISNEELDLINEKLLHKNNEIADQYNKLEKQNQYLEEVVNNRTKKLIEEREKSIVADKLKTSFLNNLDQEIQTPMNSITGFSTMLFDSSLTKDKRNEYLGIINSNVDVLLESIDNMVLLARIQANAIKPKIQQFSINSLFINCKEYFEEKALSYLPKDLKLRIETPHTNQLATIHSDYDKIWLIVTKLLNFAIKYTSHGEIYLFYQLIYQQTNDTKPNQYLIITVRYNMSEIAEKFNLIFGHQNKVEINKNKSVHINEFGIEIAKGLTEILNGEFKIQSNNEDIIFSNKIPDLSVDH